MFYMVFYIWKVELTIINDLSRGTDIKISAKTHKYLNEFNNKRVRLIEDAVFPDLLSKRSVYLTNQ